jgi:transposase
MQYVGIDWAYSRAAWCARMEGGAIAAEGLIPADEDGLARLVLRLGPDVKACVEMMSGAAWVRDQLAAASWAVEVADARKVKALAPLTAKTDKVDARLLSELSRRDLVPALWVPPLDERALRERLRRRMHLVRLRTSAKGRVFGLQTSGACASRSSACARRTASSCSSAAACPKSGAARSRSASPSSTSSTSASGRSRRSCARSLGSTGAPCYSTRSPASASCSP